MTAADPPGISVLGEGQWGLWRSAIYKPGFGAVISACGSVHMLFYQKNGHLASMEISAYYFTRNQ